jgi:hypothetical protein
MSEQHTEAINQENTPESRIQAAIEAVTATEAPEESIEAPEESVETEETQEEVQETAEGNGVPLDSDQPLTPGEENIAESSKLASLARRERRAREHAKEREAQLTKKEQELEDRLKRAEDLENRLSGLKDEFRHDPISALKDLGIEDGYADVASALYDEELGESAPPEHKSQREVRALRERLAQFEKSQKEQSAKQEETKKQEEVQAFQRKFVNELETHMKAAPSGLTYANAVFEKNPEDAIHAMYNIAYSVAVEDPNAPLPTTQQLAEALNQNLETTLAPVIDAILAARSQSIEDETKVEEEPARQTKTLRNAQSRRTSKQSPAATEEERIQRALQAIAAG